MLADSRCVEYNLSAIVGKESVIEACEGVEVIFALVTADQAESAAVGLSKAPLHNALYIDCNSCSPETKRRSAEIIEAVGGRYVDVSIMMPVHPKLHKAPCLFAGSEAKSALALAQGCRNGNSNSRGSSWSGIGSKNGALRHN